MLDADQLAFGATFLKLRNVFNLRGDKADVRQAMEAYFRVLRPFPLKAVEAGADAWLGRGEHFPKPAQWRDAIPKAKSAGLLVMPEDDAAEYLHAVSLGYEGASCSCHECEQAGVSHRLLRYVPEQDADGQDVRMLIGEKVVVRGHWAHGEELKRFYAARDAYWALWDRNRGKRPRKMPRVPLAAVAAEER